MTASMDLSSLFASHNLVGHTLSNGWKIMRKLEKDPSKGQTGGNFSICYLAERDGKEYFVKVINFMDVISSVDETNQRTTEFLFERDLSNYCRDRNVKNVAIMLDAGEDKIDGFPFPNVPYLVFEKADSDVRDFLDFTSRQDVAWSFKSLREVALGLDELHNIGVSHLDVKPSNVLVFDSKVKGKSKISDLGRSICETISGPFDGLSFSGDCSYAPLDVLFRYNWTTDINLGRYVTDLYMLGNLVVFYLTKTTMSALMLSNLPYSITPFKTLPPYAAIMADVEEAFLKSLETIEKSLPSVIVSKERVMNDIRNLCNPNPERRGHPKNLDVNTREISYSLRRFVTSFEVMRKETELQLFRKTLGK